MEVDYKSLIRSCAEGNLKAVRTCLRSAAASSHIDKEDQNGWTGLIMASYYGHLVIVQELLEAGAK